MQLTAGTASYLPYYLHRSVSTVDCLHFLLVKLFLYIHVCLVGVSWRVPVGQPRHRSSILVFRAIPGFYSISGFSQLSVVSVVRYSLYFARFRCAVHVLDYLRSQTCFANVSVVLWKWILVLFELEVRQKVGGLGSSWTDWSTNLNQANM